VRLSSGKKVIFAWHDITPIYVGVALIMSAVAWFALAGLRVALNHPAYRVHAWVPALLLVMSGLLAAAALGRLVRRTWRYFREQYGTGGGWPL